MQEIEQLPRALKIVMLFIDRVGFPVLAFVLMFYMSFVSMQKVTIAVTDNTKALSILITRLNDFQTKVETDHRSMVNNQTEITQNQGIILNDIKQLDRGR